MKNKLCLVVLIVLSCSSYSCITNQAGSHKSGAQETSWSQAIYCQVDNPNVCAVAQSKEDCAKLGGKKVGSCSSSK